MRSMGVCLWYYWRVRNIQLRINNFLTFSFSCLLVQTENTWSSASSRDFNPTYGSLEWNHVYNNMGGVWSASKDTPSPFLQKDAEVKVAKERTSPRKERIKRKRIKIRKMFSSRNRCKDWSGRYNWPYYQTSFTKVLTMAVFLFGWRKIWYLWSWANKRVYDLKKAKRKNCCWRSFHVYYRAKGFAKEDRSMWPTYTFRQCWFE